MATSVGLVLQLLGPSSRRTRTLRRVTAVLPTALALARGFIEEPTVEVRDSTSLLGSLTSAALVAFNEVRFQLVEGRAAALDKQRDCAALHIHERPLH